MNCSKIHYLLSLNLDGRLSSSRREVLLRHLDDCSACRELDTEMHAAQDLALQLPRERVNAEFQDTLWDRIRAGEGTPDGVFHQSVSVATRVRYLATGAAAAAMFLLVLNWLGPQREQHISPRQASTSIAAATPGHIAEPRVAATDTGDRSLRRHVNDSILDARPVGLSPAVVAQTAQQTFVRSIQDLQGQVPGLRKRLKVSALDEQKRRIASTVRDLRAAASLMLWMADDEFIHLPGGMHAGFELARRGTAILERSDKPEEFLFGLEQLDEIDCNDLVGQFSIVCCDNLATFLQGFSEQITCSPETGRLFRAMTIVESGVDIDPSQPSSRMRVYIRQTLQHGK